MKSQKIDKSKSRKWGTLALLTACGGCSVDLGYVVPVVIGQAEVLIKTVPIPEAIRSGYLTDEQKAKLILIRDVRAYAGEVIGLDTEDNYTRFYDSGGQPVAFNISASAKDRFRPKSWSFPLVGTVPYLGFFDRAAASTEFNELTRLGYDVFMYPIEAYTGFEGVPNPVFSPMLERDDHYIVETIFHELLHSTVWRQNDTTFNESLATFVGRTAMLEYYAVRYPDEPQRAQAAAERVEDSDRHNAFIFELYGELETFYARDLSRERKIAEREAIYQAGRDRFAAEVLPRMHSPADYEWVKDLPINNAWMLANYRYNLDLDVFAQVHATTGFDWTETLRVFGQAARVRDPYEFLRGWLAEDWPSPGEPPENTARFEGGDMAAPDGPRMREPCPRPGAAGYWRP